MTRRGDVRLSVVLEVGFVGDGAQQEIPQDPSDSRLKRALRAIDPGQRKPNSTKFCRARMVFFTHPCRFIIFGRVCVIRAVSVMCNVHLINQLVLNNVKFFSLFWFAPIV